MSTSKPNYHHGDLRSTLLQAATDLIGEGGIDALSMRKLADRAGVSRTAPYHHFSDKQALLSALAQAGFARFEQQLQQTLSGGTDGPDALHAFVRCYIDFARHHPQTYDLMFGHSVWRAGVPSEQLKGEAHQSFRRYLERVALWQRQGVLPQGVEPLRFAQLSWSTLHGLARLLIDGIYVEPRQLDELLQLTVAMFRQTL